MASPSGSANGGIIGKSNKTSFGKCTVTAHTSSGTKTLQPGTRIVQALGMEVAGGASGGSDQGGGGGAGGLRMYRLYFYYLQILYLLQLEQEELQKEMEVIQ